MWKVFLADRKQINNPLQKSHQQYITEEWSKWGRPGLTRKQRSLLNIGILMTLNRSTELRVHIRGALRNGLTEEEITEAITHTMMYSGVPTGVEASKVAAGVIKEMRDNGELDGDNAQSGQDLGQNAKQAPPTQAVRHDGELDDAKLKAGQDGGEEAPLAS